MTCLYADLHEEDDDICYMCAPRWRLVWWDMKYRWNRIKKRIVSRRA